MHSSVQLSRSLELRSLGCKKHSSNRFVEIFQNKLIRVSAFELLDVGLGDGTVGFDS